MHPYSAVIVYTRIFGSQSPFCRGCSCSWILWSELTSLSAHMSALALSASSASQARYMHVYAYYTHICTYIYVERERERENLCICTYVYMYPWTPKLPRRISSIPQIKRAWAILLGTLEVHRYIVDLPKPKVEALCLQAAP